MSKSVKKVKRIRKKSSKRGGGYGKPSNPFVGKPWNAIGPPSNPYVPKPWGVSNNSNYYGLSRTGMDVGGYPVYFRNVAKSIYGGSHKSRKLRKSRKSRKYRKYRKYRKSRKSKDLGLKRGGSFVDFLPQSLVNLNRSIGTGLGNYFPGGRVWEGVPKTESPFPENQPKLQDSLPELL